MAKTDFAGMIKLRISRWRDYTGSSGWGPSAITSVLTSERQKEIWHWKGRKECDDGSRDIWICYAAGFGDRGSGHKSRNAAVEAGKGKEMDVPLKIPEAVLPC